MGSIKVIASLFIIIVVGGAGLFVMLFPLLFDADLKNRTGEGIVNHAWTAVELICLIGIFNPKDATMREKLGKLKKMRINLPEACESLLNDRTARMEMILHTVNADADVQKSFYHVDIYYMGYKQCFLTDMFFHTKEEAVAAFLAYIEESVEQRGDMETCIMRLSVFLR